MGKSAMGDQPGDRVLAIHDEDRSAMTEGEHSAGEPNELPGALPIRERAAKHAHEIEPALENVPVIGHEESNRRSEVVDVEGSLSKGAHL